MVVKSNIEVLDQSEEMEANPAVDAAKIMQNFLLSMMEEDKKGAKGRITKERDPAVVSEGDRLILPRAMSLEDGVKFLNRKIKESETPVSIREEVECYPLDGAYALMQVMKQIFGWATAIPTPGFFGPTPPQMINLEIDHGVHTQVLWGQFQVPGIEGAIATGADQKNGRPIFVMAGTVKQKYKPVIKKIADAVREYIKTDSVYRGKAVKLITREDGAFDPTNPPTFLDLTKVNPEELVFSDHVMDQIETNIFTPIEYTEECRTANIPLKRGVLLEGKYGTGKTLTAFVAATKCVNKPTNQWTFIYLDRVAAIREAMEFAKMYGPAVIFAEDIDRAMAGGRSIKVDDVLNKIDGVDTKGTDILTILTTNHVENINKAMMRPGRLDAIITVEAPDATAVQKLIKLYSRELLSPKADLEEVGTLLNGQIPAVIREAVERSKLYAIKRTKKTLQPGILSGTDLVSAAKGMRGHLELMAPSTKEELTAAEQLGATMAEVMEESAKKVFNGYGTNIKETHVLAKEIRQRL